MQHGASVHMVRQRLTVLIVIVVGRSRVSFTVKSIDKQHVFQQLKYLASIVVIVRQLAVEHLQTLQLLQLFLHHQQQQR